MSGIPEDQVPWANDEWKQALISAWPVDINPEDPTKGNVNLGLRIADPVDLMQDMLQYLLALERYYTGIGNGEPEAHLREANALYEDGLHYVADQDYEPDSHAPTEELFVGPHDGCARQDPHTHPKKEG